MPDSTLENVPDEKTDVVRWSFSGGTVVLTTSPDAPVAVRSIGPVDDDTTAGNRLVEVATNGDGHAHVSTHSEHHAYLTSDRLRYQSHEDDGGRLSVVQVDDVTGLRVESVLQDVPGTSSLRAWTTLSNAGREPVRVRYVSSLSLAGLTTSSRSWRSAQVHVPWNGWAAEFRWQHLSPEQCGIVAIGYERSHHGSRSRFPMTGHGSWSSGDALPMGGFTDTARGLTWLWQLENNGPWHWEVADVDPDLRVHLSGPTEREHQWTVLLAPGEAFTSVPAALTTVEGDLEDALRGLNRYRRATRRPNEDDERLPVVFNDYMNALMGDPTTAKLLPLVDAAAAVGAEYFVVDCGWYTDEPGWWDLVGDWQEASSRFPNGFVEVVDHIRGRGMVPGLWLEPEVVGVRSARAKELPDEAFFLRDGRRVTENERYQVDLRHPDVRAYLDETVDRLVADYGIGYFKFDHNINAGGAGTDVAADSPGDGTLGHTRALTAWLDGLFARHPGLVIENCSSGGMRVDHAQLQRMSIQSTSDQQDPLHYAAIAAAAPSAVTPEQAAIWAYPQGHMDAELLTFTMVNALLARIHLSGHLDRMDSEHLGAVKAALDVYKEIRSAIPAADPVWPLGLPGWYDEWLATGLADGEQTLVTVWRRGGADSASLALPQLAGRDVAVEVLHPAGAPSSGITWDGAAGTLTVAGLPAPAARLLRIAAVVDAGG